MIFFDVTPFGRILNRISSDIYTIDDSLPFILNIFLAQIFGLIGNNYIWTLFWDSWRLSGELCPQKHWRPLITWLNCFISLWRDSGSDVRGNPVDMFATATSWLHLLQSTALLSQYLARAKTALNCHSLANLLAILGNAQRIGDHPGHTIQWSLYPREPWPGRK